VKRILGLATVAGLVLSGSAADAAPAKKPKPVPMTFYFHGVNRAGEADNPPTSSVTASMDTTKPSGADSKSKQITNYIGGPNTNCSGNNLFPVWTGPLTGEIVTDVRVTFTGIGAPSSRVWIRLFQDVEGLVCNDAPKVAGSAIVDLPAGQGKVDVVIKKVKLKAKHSFQIQFSPTGELGDTSQGRIFYDSTADMSSVSFSCLPAVGKKTC
jgi:hypothetical protein